MGNREIRNKGLFLSATEVNKATISECMVCKKMTCTFLILPKKALTGQLFLQLLEMAVNEIVEQIGDMEEIQWSGTRLSCNCHLWPQWPLLTKIT